MNKINYLNLIILVCVIYTIIALFVGILDVKDSLLNIPLYFWFLAIFVPVIVHSLLIFRWFYFLRRLKLSLNLIQSTFIYLPALSLIAAPARSGEAIRGLWLYNKFGYPRQIGLLITIVERLGDLISALLIIIFALSPERFKILSVLTISIILCLYLCFRGKSKLFLFFRDLKLCIPLNNNYLEKFPILQKLRTTFLRDLRVLFFPKPLFISLSITSIAWLLESFLLYKVFVLLDVNISIEQAALIRTVMGIGGVLSFLPAGLIATESTALALSLAFGSGRVEAVAATFFIRLYTLFLPFLAGLCCFYAQKDLNMSLKRESFN